MDAGLVTSSGTATVELPGCAGTPGGSTCPMVTSPEALATTTTLWTPGLTVTTAGVLGDTNGNGVANVGETIAYTVHVSNTGTVDLDAVAVTDNLTSLSCPGTSLAVGASMDCTGSYVVTASDVAAGMIHDIASARAGSGSQIVTSAESAATQVNTAAAGTAPLAQTGFPGRTILVSSMLLLLVGLAMLIAGRSGSFRRRGLHARRRFGL